MQFKNVDGDIFCKSDAKCQKIAFSRVYSMLECIKTEQETEIVQLLPQIG